MAINDIDKLVGKVFVASSLNLGTVYKLADGAIRVQWFLKPSENDMSEFHSWMDAELGYKSDKTVNVGKATEKRAFEEWKAKQRVN